jgi:hypothetical protein
VQAITRVDAEIATVKQGVNVRSQQEPVVEPVLAAPPDRANVSGFQNRRNMSTADGAAAVIGIQDDRLEGALAKPVRGQARVAEDRPGPVSWLAEVHINNSAQNPVQELAEVGVSSRVDPGAGDGAEEPHLIPPAPAVATQAGRRAFPRKRGGWLLTVLAAV